MRPHERLKVEMRVDGGGRDFGVDGSPMWVLLVQSWPAIRNTKTGRLVRQGDQQVPVHDEEFTVRYHREVHTKWQEKRVLQVTDQYGDVYGVESVKHIPRGSRVGQLVLGCKRG